jgi:hypothetical protein
MKFKDIELQKDEIDKRFMLDALELESKRWPELGNISKRINENIIVP